jgi:hypothetical protein
MANPLLDFVMSIVRDPDAAAHYAADPAGAIHDANLTDVTSADVNALIPVVSESLSMGTPHTGAEALAGDPAGNVWTSGAATAAFDAFDDHLSVPVIDDPHAIESNVIAQPADSLHAGLDAIDDHGISSVTGIDDPSVQFTHAIIDDAPLVGDTVDTVDTDWHHPVVDDHPHLDPGDPGFDVFS